MKTAIAKIRTLETTSNKLKFPQPPAQLTFSQSWLDKRKLKAKDLKVYRIYTNDLAPVLCEDDYVMVDKTVKSVVGGKIHAFMYDSKFHIKRLDMLPNGNLMMCWNDNQQVIKQEDYLWFHLMGLVVHRQGGL